MHTAYIPTSEKVPTREIKNKSMLKDNFLTKDNKEKLIDGLINSLPRFGLFQISNFICFLEKIIITNSMEKLVVSEENTILSRPYP